MLQTMRDNAQGIVAKVIVFFIILVFALWGVESIVNIGGGESAVIQVGDREITEPEIQRVIEQQKANLRQQFGEQFDENLFNSELLRQSAVEQLIQDNLLQVQADELGLFASRNLIDETIVSIPAFQLDGRFDPDQFRSVLRTNGWTPLSFRDSLAQDVKTSQLQQAISMSAIATPFQTRYSAMLDGQLRTVSWVDFAARDLVAEVTVEEADIAAFYEENSGQFRTPESVTIRYAGFDRAAIESQQEVSDEELEQAYKDYLDELAADEERSSSHILIEVGDNRSEDEAQALAQQILEELEAGADFASLASEYSDDIASAADGGNLGFVGRGAFVPEFEQALFALEEGQVSNPVKTDFGYHIIRLDEVRLPDAASAEDKQQELADWIRSEKASLFMAEQAQELGNLAFSAGSIEEVADAMGLEVRESAAFTRESGEGIAASESVRQQAFAENILIDRELSDVVETDSGLFVFTVAQHNEPEVLPLEVVRGQIVNVLKQQQADDVAKARAEAVLAGEAEAEWQQAVTRFAQSSELPRAAQRRAFAMSTGDVELVRTDSGFAVVKVDAIQTPSMADIMVDDSVEQRLVMRDARASMVAFNKWARENTDIQQ